MNRTALIGCLILLAILLGLAVWWVSSFHGNEDGNEVTETSVAGAALSAKGIAGPSASEPASGPRPLDGMSFQLSRVDGIAVPGSRGYPVSFEDGTMHLKICNDLAGPYTGQSGILHAALASAGAKTCVSPAGIMNLEAGAIAVLASSSTRYTLSDGTLTITASGHSAVLTRVE